MKFKFWEKPKEFIFEKKRKAQVILHDVIGIIVGAIIGIAEAISFELAVSLASPLLLGLSAAEIMAYVIVGGVMMGISALSSSLSSKSGRPSSLATGGMLQNTSMIIDPIKVIYGKARVGASQVFVHTEGGVTNPTLHVIAVWCEGPVNRIATDGLGDMIWINDLRMQDFQAYLGYSWVTHEFHNGSMEQGVSPTLPSFFAEWADAMKGTCYSYFKCSYQPQLWTQFPQFTALIEGRTLFDPRDGSIAYSTNPALAWRDFMTHPRYGGGIRGSAIDKQSIIDAANWYESNSFAFNGAIADRKEFIENMEEIEMSMRAEKIYSNGFYKLQVQKYDTPVTTITEKDIKRDDAEINAFGIHMSGIQEHPKRIKVTFADPTNNYIPSFCYWPEASPSAVETDREWKEIILIGASDFTLALKLAKFYYLKGQYSRTFTFIAHPRLIPYELGDMVYVTHDTTFPYGSIPEDWNNKICRILNISISQDNQVAVTLGEEDSSVYDMTVNVASHTAYQSTLPSSTGIPDSPTNLSAATGEDTTTVARDDAYIDFQWDNMGPGVNYELRYRKSSDSIWSTRLLTDPGGIVSIPTKTGTGTQTMQTGGNFSGAALLNYKVEIDGVGTPNTFKWSDDGGATWDATGVQINSLLWQTLNNNVQIKFSANTGGVIGDNWTFTASPKTPVKVKVGYLPVDVQYVWQVCAYIAWLNKSNYATPATPITTWKATAGPSMADVILTVSSGGGTVFLEWNKDVEETNFDKWLIFRNITNNPATAMQIDEKSRQTRSYRDVNVISNQPYYYWLKGTDRNGNISGFSMVASITHIHAESNILYSTIGSNALPANDGTMGYVAKDSIPLQDCDDYTQFSTSSAVSGSVEISQETLDKTEGTGCLRIKLNRYPKVRYFETGNGYSYLGISTTYQYAGQCFKLASAKDIKAVSVNLQKIGSPSNITASIYNDSGGKPGASLGSCTILAADVPTSNYGWAWGVFGSTIALAGSTKYWLIITCTVDLSNYYFVRLNVLSAFGDADEVYGFGSNLTTGFTKVITWDMLFRVCVAGDALNKYIYATIAAQDLSSKTYIKSSIKSNRTGGFLSHSFGEAAIGEQNYAITVNIAGVWELKASDISALAGTSRDAVIKIGLKVTNMDADAEFLWDYCFANIGEPFPMIRRGTTAEKFLTELPFNHALIRTLNIPHLINTPSFTITKRTTVGTTTLTVPVGKIYIPVFFYGSASATIYINDDAWIVGDTTYIWIDSDIILKYGDHIDFTLTFAGTALLGMIELDEDQYVTPLYQSVTNASTYTVPTEKSLIMRRVKAFSTATLLLVDSENVMSLASEQKGLNFILDAGSVVKADASSAKFFGYLIPKTL